jgi:hypothetical protein
MAESKSPIICVTCQRSLPDDLKSEDAPKYFSQGPLLPRSDSAHAFGSEVGSICEYIKAIADVIRYDADKEIEPDTYSTLFELVGELSEEAIRRQDLALEAMNEIWKRDHG